MAPAAARARVTVSSLVSSPELIICRKSCTGLLLPAGTAGVACAVIAGLVRAVDEGGVVDLGLQAGAAGLVEDIQVVDPGGLWLGALLVGLRMHGAVVAGSDPAAEQPVQRRQVRGPRAGLPVIAGDLDEELGADGAEESLYLPPPLRPAGTGAGQLDAQHRAGAQQP